MRLSVLAATALFVTLPAVAQAGSFDGFYLGAQVGGAFTSFKETQTSPVLGGGVEKTDSLSANGLVGGVVGGWGISFGKVYLGAEFDTTFGGRSFTDTVTDPVNPSRYKLKTGTEWGFSARPGYAINDHALVYGLFGFEQAPLKATSTASGTVFDKTETVFRLGAGTELAVAGPITVRIDYLHTFLDKVSVYDQFGDGQTFDPSEDKIKVGVVYHF
ncbi:MAG: porin family protein [Telmatospirillum sp.]|nr:porin family protein [Telmatospirillum sp.]